MRKSLLISIVVSFIIFLIFSPLLLKLTSYLHPIVLAVVFLCLFILIFSIILWYNKQTIHLSYHFFKSIIIVYTLALIILLFFRPNDQSYQTWNLVPFSTIRFYLSGKVNGLISFYNLAANIGLFIPYGIFLLSGKSITLLKRIFLPAALISLIEILQFLTHRGSLDIDDLILNLLGVFIGYRLYRVFKQIVILKY